MHPPSRLFFYAGPLKVDQAYELPSTLTKHLIQVLRYSLNDSFLLFNGDGCFYAATLIKIKPKPIAQITAIVEKQQKPAFHLHLAQALCKQNKIDFILQKAVELGVVSFTPLITQYSQVKYDAARSLKKKEHWDKIIQSACEQSKQAYLPRCENIQDFNTLISSNAFSQKLIFTPQATLSLTLFQSKTSLIDAKDTLIIIGSEGGFSPEEIQLATAHHCTPISLGKRILRAETAGLVCLSLMNFIYESMALEHSQ